MDERAHEYFHDHFGVLELGMRFEERFGGVNPAAPAPLPPAPKPEPAPPPPNEPPANPADPGPPPPNQGDAKSGAEQLKGGPEPAPADAPQNGGTDKVDVPKIKDDVDNQLGASLPKDTRIHGADGSDLDAAAILSAINDQRKPGQTVNQAIDELLAGDKNKGLTDEQRNAVAAILRRQYGTVNEQDLAAAAATYGFDPKSLQLVPGKDGADPSNFGFNVATGDTMWARATAFLSQGGKAPSDEVVATFLQNLAKANGVDYADLDSVRDGQSFVAPGSDALEFGGQQTTVNVSAARDQLAALGALPENFDLTKLTPAMVAGLSTQQREVLLNMATVMPDTGVGGQHNAWKDTLVGAYTAAVAAPAPTTAVPAAATDVTTAINGVLQANNDIRLFAPDDLQIPRGDWNQLSLRDLDAGAVQANLDDWLARSGKPQDFNNVLEFIRNRFNNNNNGGSHRTYTVGEIDALESLARALAASKGYALPPK